MQQGYQAPKRGRVQNNTKSSAYLSGRNEESRQRLATSLLPSGFFPVALTEITLSLPAWPVFFLFVFVFSPLLSCLHMFCCCCCCFCSNNRGAGTRPRPTFVNEWPDPRSRTVCDTVDLYGPVPAAFASTAPSLWMSELLSPCMRLKSSHPAEETRFSHSYWVLVTTQRSRP